MNTEALEALSAGLRGEALAAGDGGFDEARKVWNAGVEKHPAAIVKARGVADVIDAVNFAREQGMGVSVRGGGHHVSGAAVLDGGLVIDLSEMRSVRVDVPARRARAEGGALLMDVDRETLAHGLAVPMGLFSETGVGGLTLSGGYGWLRRKYGLSCDNLVSADVVTADGRLVQASADENPDLFWALRGGGTDLGVVTSFEFRAHPIDELVYFFLTAYPVDEAPRVLKALDEFMRTAPREASPLAVIWTVPPTENYPEQVWHKPFVAVLGPYAGPAEEGEEVYEPLRKLGEPLLEISERMPFSIVQKLFDEEYPRDGRYYWKSIYLNRLDDEAIGTLVKMGELRPSPSTSLDIWPMGGAIADFGPEDGPLAHRDAPYLIGIESNWRLPQDDAANIAWARETQAALTPFSTGGSYVNFEDATEGSRVAATYGASYERLVAVKRRYDPANLFRSRRGLID